jgi:hypothetical protein
MTPRTRALYRILSRNKQEPLTPLQLKAANSLESHQTYHLSKPNSNQITIGSIAAEALTGTILSVSDVKNLYCTVYLFSWQSPVYIRLTLPFSGAYELHGHSFCWRKSCGHYPWPGSFSNQPFLCSQCLHLLRRESTSGPFVATAACWGWGYTMLRGHDRGRHVSPDSIKVWVFLYL